MFCSFCNYHLWYKAINFIYVIENIILICVTSFIFMKKYNIINNDFFFNYNQSE